jgi:hypothetical protein
MIKEEITVIMKKLNDSEFEGIISFFKIKKSHIADIIKEVNDYMKETIYYAEMISIKEVIKEIEENDLKKYEYYYKIINISIFIISSLFSLFFLLFIPDYASDVIIGINIYSLKYLVLFVILFVFCFILKLIVIIKISDIKKNIEKFKSDLNELQNNICYLKNSLILLKINQRYEIINTNDIFKKYNELKSES